MHDSSDNYEVQKAENYLKMMEDLLGHMTVKSILSAAKNPENNESLDIVPNFGEKTLLQIFRDVKEG